MPSLWNIIACSAGRPERRARLLRPCQEHSSERDARTRFWLPTTYTYSVLRQSLVLQVLGCDPGTRREHARCCAAPAQDFETRVDVHDDIKHTIIMHFRRRHGCWTEPLSSTRPPAIPAAVSRAGTSTSTHPPRAGHGVPGICSPRSSLAPSHSIQPYEHGMRTRTASISPWRYVSLPQPPHPSQV